MVSEIKHLDQTITYRSPGIVFEIEICSLSDASHGCTDGIYGQTGIIYGLKNTCTEPEQTIFHAVRWTSHKKRRVSYSYFGSEIIAAANDDDRGYDNNMAFLSLLPYRPLLHDLLF